MSGIFISYRRDESAGYVGRLYDQLLKYFDKKEIFLDVDAINPGEDFVSVIEKALGSCHALIAVIGPRWLEIPDENGKRRLDSPNDTVRLEIATAFARNIRVVPALIERASMPDAKALPKDLAALARRNAIELSHDRFACDVERLVHTIGDSKGKMKVSFGKFYLLAIESSLLNPMEVFEVYLDGRQVGQIEGPGFTLKVEKLKKRSWLPVVVPVEVGVDKVHKVFIRHRLSARSPNFNTSNELSFKMRGGQSIEFTIELETSSIGVSQLVLKSPKPIIEAKGKEG